MGNLAGQQRPVFAAIVPIVVIRVRKTDTVRGSLGRVIGVLAGVAIGLLALSVTHASLVSVGIVVMLALVADRLISHIPHVGVDTRNQSAISALLMFFVATGLTGYAAARLWETAIGSAVALAVELVDDQLVLKLSSRAAPG